MDFRELSIAALDLYRSRLREIPNVRYVFAFEMAKSASSHDYFLVFASQSAVGLKKMKEVMRKIDQTGAFEFRDVSVNQPRLIRFDEPEEWARVLCTHFSGQDATLTDIEDYVLNETPLAAFKKEVLAPAERTGLIEVVGDGSRRRCTYPEDKVRHVHFKGLPDA
jgi:hypothetical protein